MFNNPYYVSLNNLTHAAITDAETGTALSALNGHSCDVHNVTFSPDGLKLTSGLLDYTIRVWHTDNTELILQIAHQDGIRSVVWSPEGQQLVPPSNDTTIDFWNSLNRYRFTQPCTGHTDIIYLLSISSVCTFIATASADNTAQLWNTKPHQLQSGQSLKHTTPWVYHVPVSHDRALLVSASLWRLSLVRKFDSGLLRLYSNNITYRKG